MGELCFGSRIRWIAVREWLIFFRMSLKTQISPKELEDLIAKVRVMVEGDASVFLLSFE
jgi:hypothetical protein